MEKYLEDLDGDADDEMLAGVKSLDDLMVYARTIEPPGSSSYTALNRLGPTLKFVDDFSAVVAVCLGANAKVTAFVWGSLRLIITLASSTDDALQKVLDMLEELSLSLPRLRYYEENFPLDRNFENTLVDLYSEIICFYARLIRHYRTNPHLPMQQAGWQGFQRDFASTVRRVKYLSSTVEKEADLVKMKSESGRYEEVLEALKGLGPVKSDADDRKQYHHIPASVYPRYRGRSGDMDQISQALRPDVTPSQLKSFAVYGMGGVGKTQLALRYAFESKKHFDTILWIAADTSLSFDQSFREVAIGLGLSQESSDGSNELPATARVKEWLSNPNNHHKWLVIFDNADDIGLLQHAWPANGTGSVLITSRDFSCATMVANAGLQLEPFNDELGADVLLRLLDIPVAENAQRFEARKICQTLGGLPLALDQIASFITQRKLRIQDFLPLYERNSAKIDARKQVFNDYPHSVATVFELALESLTGSSLHLQNILALLEPDSVPESIFAESAELLQGTELEFLGDEMDIGDAEETLLQAALVNKDPDRKVLSMHRLIQNATLRRLCDADKQKYFKHAMDILSPGFPETWSKDVGHQKKQWSKSERNLPHINNLVNLVAKKIVIAQDSDNWAELLLRCGWYLYEKEQYNYVKTFTQTALDSFSDKNTLVFASATDLMGLVDLDMATPQKALVSFEKGLRLRQALVKPDDPFVAFAANNLALAYTELNELDKAEKYHKQAIKLRLAHARDRIGNSYSNYAVTLLRMGRPNEAEDILMKCPSLKGCTEETFLAADNPRFVGDMVLLSRIRRAQGRENDALRLASKALAWRQKVHGDRFKTCDSMYDVGCLLHSQGQTATALGLLDNITRIAETLDMGEGHAARAEWMASRMLKDIGKEKESLERLKNATLLKDKTQLEEDDPRSGQDSWEALVPYMLW